MSVYLAHGVSPEEIKKFDYIDEFDGFSIALYNYQEGKEGLLPFQHTHEEYEFIIPLSTIPLMRYEKANYIGEVGFVYPVNPFVNHGLEFASTTSSVISITVEVSLVEQYKKELGFEGRYFYTRFIASKELMLGITKFQELAHKPVPNKMILEIIRKHILSILIKDGLASGEDNRRPEKVYAKNIKQIILYMFEHYSDPDLTINKLAELCGYSTAYFSRAFKAYMNDPPVVHLNKLRLSEAKELFHDHKLTLGQIATMVGYKNLSTFTEAFKNIIGMKPKEYRDKYII